MRRAANDNWPESQPLVVPHAARGDSPCTNFQVEVQDRIRAALRAMEAYDRFISQVPDRRGTVYPLLTHANGWQAGDTK